MSQTDTPPIINDAQSGTVIVAPRGEIDMSRSPVLRNTLREVLGNDPGRLIVDLSEVAYMDSSGLATLVEAMRTAKEHATPMLLCGLNDQVRAIFEISRLHHFFTITDTRQQAIEH